MSEFKQGDLVKYNSGISEYDDSWNYCVVIKDIGWAYEVERVSDRKVGHFVKGWTLPFQEREQMKSKFKIGDFIRWNTCSSEHWKNSKIVKVDESNGEYTVEDAKNGPGIFDFVWDLELVKPAEPEITEGSLWIHTISGQIAKVILANDDGRVVLSAVNKTDYYDEDTVFVYTPEMKPFVEAYKQYAPEPKTVKLVKFACVQQFLHDGDICLDPDTYDSEEEARREWVDGLGSYRLLDVIKIEWEGEIPAV